MIDFAGGWAGYSKSAPTGFVHQRSAHLALLHRALRSLKTWLNGNHHGAEPDYLKRRAAGFVFRFNRCNAPMTAFHSLLGIASSI